MKQLLLPAAALLLSVQVATAQIKLPQASPSATVTQTVGTTDITVTYSRPSARGRAIFGSLIPYGQLWRTGANMATKLTTSTDLTVEGQTLPAGSYAIFSIPEQSEWTLIFNKNTNQGGTADYKQDQDALRVKIKAQPAGDKLETFTISFGDLTDSTATLNLMWADVKAVANVAVDASANAAANVDKAVADKPNDPAVLQAAAGYNLSKGRNLDQSLDWVNKAIGAKETFRNLFLKAQLLGKLGRYAEAVPVAQRALQLGESSNDPAFPFFKDAIQKSITDYSALLPKPANMLKGKKKKA